MNQFSEKDLYQLQMKALEEGMSYQTLMASVLHKFVNGAFAFSQLRNEIEMWVSGNKAPPSAIFGWSLIFPEYRHERQKRGSLGDCRHRIRIAGLLLDLAHPLLSLELHPPGRGGGHGAYGVRAVGYDLHREPGLILDPA
jgi:hypothetical protein